MKRLHILTLVSVVLAATIFFMKNVGGTKAPAKELIVPKEWMKNTVSQNVPPADLRPPDQTFLTFPEWYLVYGPEEQANYFAEKTSTTFPFMEQVGSLWQSYGIVYDQIRDNFEFNTGYHVMIMVIAVSSTAEFGFKGWYETVVGRLTDTQDSMTQEDLFNARFTRDYVEFIKVRPWYEYNFKRELTDLWSKTDLFGTHLFRKWDRKYILTSELLVKVGYGWLIGLGTATAYDEARPNTIIEVSKFNGLKMDDVEVIKLDTAALSVLSVPRYAAFKDVAKALAASGVQLRSIAGNDGALLMTWIAPLEWKYVSDPANGYVELFEQQIAVPSGPGIKRVAVVTIVPRLHETIQKLHDLKLEHIYDY